MCHPVSDNLPEKTPIRVLEVCDEIATKIAEIAEIATYFLFTTERTYRSLRLDLWSGTLVPIKSN